MFEDGRDQRFISSLLKANPSQSNLHFPSFCFSLSYIKTLMCQKTLFHESIQNFGNFKLRSTFSISLNEGQPSKLRV